MNKDGLPQEQSKELHRLRDLGSYVQIDYNSGNEDTICRHGTNIRRYSKGYGGEERSQCPQCIIDEETFIRLMRIEIKLDAVLQPGVVQLPPELQPKRLK